MNEKDGNPIFWIHFSPVTRKIRPVVIHKMSWEGKREKKTATEPSVQIPCTSPKLATARLSPQPHPNPSFINGAHWVMSSPTQSRKLIGFGSSLSYQDAIGKWDNRRVQSPRCCTPLLVTSPGRAELASLPRTPRCPALVADLWVVVTTATVSSCWLLDHSPPHLPRPSYLQNNNNGEKILGKPTVRRCRGVKALGYRWICQGS